MEVEEGETQNLKCEAFCKEHSPNCRWRLLEETCKKAEARVLELELEIENKKNDYEALEAKFKKLEAEKIALEDELRASRTSSRAHQVKVPSSSCFKDERKAKCGQWKDGDRVIDLTMEEEDEDEDNVVQLMTENSVLECEKRKAESELELWKKKFMELELRASRFVDAAALRGLGQANHNTGSEATDQLLATGTPYSGTPYKHAASAIGGKRGAILETKEKSGRRVRQHLSFEEEISPSKKIAPSTPGSAISAHLRIIDVCDSDVESETNGMQINASSDHKSGEFCIKVDKSLGSIVDGKKDMNSGTVCSLSYKEEMDDCKDNVQCILTPKRKKAANIVTSDTESDENDNIPICKLKRIHLRERVPDNAGTDMKSCSMPSNLKDNGKATATPSRRRLFPLSKFEEKGKAQIGSLSDTTKVKYRRGIPTTGDFQDSESENVGSDSTESEGDSLHGFIVNSSDEPEDDSAYSCSYSEDESDGNTNLDEILSTLKRSKDSKFKWDFEAEMLAALGKDSELCMKAVCAIYRQQTSEEQKWKETFCTNKRGFSKFDAVRGSHLAEFLTGGDPTGDVKKSVQELEEYDSKAVELCRTLATRYSKQLFEIYKNKEDPLFLPH
uniref:Uncharacterized protein MANES_06G157000 n=1 Tax=Rhizophora mucronata TaxID=61149 RepID=A0A2P2NYB9_RHIMU